MGFAGTSVKGVKHLSIIGSYSQLGVLSTVGSQALTIASRWVIEDTKRSVYLGAVGASEADIMGLGEKIAVSATQVFDTHSGIMPNDLSSDSSLVVSTEEDVHWHIGGGAALYVSREPSGKPKMIREKQGVYRKFSGYFYLSSSRLDDQDLEVLSNIARNRAYPILIARDFENYLKRSSKSNIALAVVGVRLPLILDKRLLSEVDSYMRDVASHRGMRRKNNEDSALATNVKYSYGGRTFSHSILIVADGAGGHRYGEVASRKAVVAAYEELLSFRAYAEPLSSLKRAVEIANREVLDFRKKTMSDAATTLTATLVKERQLYVAHCGDSRMYVVGDNISLLTEDHKYVTELVKLGVLKKEQAKFHPQRNVITSALGMENPRVDLREQDLSGNDAILLCTDGLSDVVDDEEIRGIMVKNKLPKNIADELIHLANKRGGPDNITLAMMIPTSWVL